MGAISHPLCQLMQTHFRHFRLPVLALSLLLAACQRETVAPTPGGPGTTSQNLPEHLTLGNPSGATADLAQLTNYLLLKPQYALSYHRDRGIPN
jgi:endonuclease G